MSVALLIKDGNPDTMLVPVATEATYAAVWQAGAKALQLQWVEAMQFGIHVMPEHLAEILDELRMLRGWFEASAYPSQTERLDLLVNALKKLRFAAGETASIG